MAAATTHKTGWSTTRKLTWAGIGVAILSILGVLLFPLMLVLMVAGAGAATQSAACAPTDGSRSSDSAPTTEEKVADLNPDQMNNAAAVVATGRNLDIPNFGIVVALATASQESDFVNYANDGTGADLAPEQHDVDRSLELPHDAVGTDHGSVGIFQQQYPWWGNLNVLMDPQSAARKFYQALKKVDQWRDLPVTVAAQRVQRSAYPGAYADDEPLARQLLATLNDEVATTRGEATATPVSNLCGPGSAMSCPPTDLDVEKGLTPDALRVVRCVVDQFDITDLGGVGERTNNPGSDHPTGRAVDVMIKNHQTTQGNQLGWRVARWARNHAAELGITYIIFDAKIFSVDRAEQGWRDYTLPSGSSDPTAAHKDHVHISVTGNAAGRKGASTQGAVLPIAAGDYQLTSPYGYRSNVAGGGVHELHTGQDFAANIGTPIRAVAEGKVTTAGRCACGYGNYVVIKAGNLEFYYAHQDSINVSGGQRVKPGQIIGHVGATGRVTGPHLHFEIRRNGHSEDPIPWLKQQGLQP